VDRTEAFVPNFDVGRLPLFDMVRADEPADALSKLTDFLRLPEPSQRILERGAPDGRPGVVAVANAQQARTAFPEDLIRSILAAHRRAGFSVLVGCDGTPPAHREPFDFVFHLDGMGGKVRAWDEETLVCEKGVDSGPLRDRRPIALRDVPILAEVLARATRSS